MASPPSEHIELGSTTWTGAEEYEDDISLFERANTFLDHSRWDRLLEICSEHHHGVQCKLAESFAAGHDNMVRKVIFEDGESWVARVRMPDMRTGLYSSGIKQVLSSEVACMKLFSERTSIPVPKVYHFDLGTDDIGAPYILMQYIHGTTAYELREILNAPLDQYGTVEQDHKFRQRMAAIQSELASLKFDQIGSIYHDPTTQGFYIGPDCQTRQGPWDSSSEYYHYLANKVLGETAQHAPSKITEDPSFALPVLFEKLMELYMDKSSIRGPFGVVHQDFGAHNLLVDENFEILALIDFDGVIAGPIEMQAQFPRLTGLDPSPPFYVPTEPFAIEVIKEIKPKLEEYQRMVRSAEEDIHKGMIDQSASRPQTQPSDLMLSDVAAIVQGLQLFGWPQLFMRQRWMHSFSRLLHKKILQELTEHEKMGDTDA